MSCLNVTSSLLNIYSALEENLIHLFYEDDGISRLLPAKKISSVKILDNNVHKNK